MLTYERLKTRATEFLALTGLTVKEFDAYINLTEMGARWYDADLGCWISPDPIVPQPGNPQAFNRYSYSANNPLRYVDPSGHDGIDVVNFFAGLGYQWVYSTVEGMH